MSARLLVLSVALAAGAVVTSLAGLMMVVAVAAANPALPTVTLPLRVHVLTSSRADLDARPIVDRATVVARLAEINATFAPAGIQWRLEGIEVESVEPGPGYAKVVAGTAKVSVALKELVDPSKMLAPAGWDLYVARNLAPLKIGGAYICEAGGSRGKGAAFISAAYGNGKPFPVRKWSHELGHSLGLSHTPCDAAHADQLMMSGKCEHAGKGRDTLTAEQVARARKVAAKGGPHACSR